MAANLARRYYPLAALFVTAATPFVVACAKDPVTPGPPRSETAEASAPSTSESSVGANRDASSQTSVASSAATQEASPGDPPPPPPSPKPGVAAACKAAASKVNAYLDASRACNKTSDCVAVQTECGTQGVCGTSINASKTAGLVKVSAGLESLHCFAAGVVPCPSCPAPPPVACAGGHCTR